MNNGLIAFTRRIFDYTPRNFSQLDSTYVMVAPFWADVDTRFYNPGRVYYRQIRSTTCKQLGDTGNEIYCEVLSRETIGLKRNCIASRCARTTWEHCFTSLNYMWEPGTTFAIRLCHPFTWHSVVIRVPTTVLICTRLFRGNRILSESRSS